MIPSRTWGASEAEKTIVLCLQCVEQGDYTPPKAVVIKNGQSVCINHAVTGPQIL